MIRYKYGRISGVKFRAPHTYKRLKWDYYEAWQPE